MTIGYFAGCAGLEGTLLSLLDAPALISWPGNKSPWGEEILRQAALEEVPVRVWLNEPDPLVRRWLEWMAQPDLLLEAAAVLESWRNDDLKNFWLELRNWRGPSPAEELARWAFVHGNSYSSRGTHWKKPPRPEWEANLRPRGLVRRLRRLAAVRWPEIRISGLNISDLDPNEVETWLRPVDRLIFSFDPPYAGTTGYKGGRVRLEESLRLALLYSGRGWEVLFHEGRDLREELKGWRVEDLLRVRRNGQTLKNFRPNTTGEFLHLSPSAGRVP